jgi:SAM-dependent methyltransferase
MSTSAGSDNAAATTTGAAASGAGPAAAGVSAHYLGARGVEYVRQRYADADLTLNEIEFRFFAPYVGAGDAVLEFGCGTAGMLPFLGEVAASVTGLEVNPAAAERARRFGHPVVERLEELGDVPRFDVIVSNHVLEHVRDVCGTLERLRRVLRPGGRAAFKLPIDDIRAARQRTWSRDDADHHLQTWTPRLFANVLFESGFDVRECRVVNHAFHPRLSPLAKVGLAGLGYWALSALKHRRQLFAVAVNPAAMPAGGGAAGPPGNWKPTTGN